MLSQAKSQRRLTAATFFVAALALVGLAAIDLVRWQTNPVELILPWYESASTGDGLGPESVSTWAIPPPVSFVHPSETQSPTKWNGDSSLNGGNKEWAEEDAALHAYNMENWRNKILETQLGRQKMQAAIMNIGSNAKAPTVLVAGKKAAPSKGKTSRDAAVVKASAIGVAGAVRAFEKWIGKYEDAVKVNANAKKPDEAALSKMKRWFKSRVLRRLKRRSRSKRHEYRGRIRALKRWLRKKLAALEAARKVAAPQGCGNGGCNCGKKGCAAQNSGVYFANNKISGSARVYVYPPSYGTKTTTVQKGPTPVKTSSKAKPAASKPKTKNKKKTVKKFGGPMSLGEETQEVFDNAIAKISALSRPEHPYRTRSAHRNDHVGHEAALLRKVMRSLHKAAHRHPSGLRTSFVEHEESKNVQRLRNVQRLLHDISAIKALKHRFH